MRVELDGLVGDEDLTAGEVDVQFPDHQQLAKTIWQVLALKDHLQACHDLVFADGTRRIVIRARVQPLHAIKSLALSASKMIGTSLR